MVCRLAEIKGDSVKRGPVLYAERGSEVPIATLNTELIQEIADFLTENLFSRGLSDEEQFIVVGAFRQNVSQRWDQIAHENTALSRNAQDRANELLRFVKTTSPL